MIYLINSFDEWFILKNCEIYMFIIFLKFNLNFDNKKLDICVKKKIQIFYRIKIYEKN